MNTKPTTLAQLSNKKIDNLLALEKITLKDLEGVSDPERRRLANKATKILAKLTGTARDNFLEKIEQVMPGHAKNDIWEYNHAVISTVISNYMHKHGVMPGKSTIAEETGLSRPTIDKHLIAYRQHPEFIAEMEQFKLMSNQILVNVFKYASNGDIRAARLYFEMVGTLNKQPAGTVVNAQNNYIQINNTILSQEKLKQLSDEQLTQIENIVTKKEYRLSETVASQMLLRS
ncbi:MAG: hypothetical protein ABI367_13555 [Mucilaginibacter sp.]